MKPIDLEQLSIFNSGTTIYCHPNSYYKIQRALNSVEHKDNIPSYIHRPNSVNIITNHLLDEYIQNGWELVEPYKSDKLVQWVDDITNPPSWAIAFKIVKPAMKLAVYIIDDYYFRTRYETPIGYHRQFRGVITNQS